MKEVLIVIQANLKRCEVNAQNLRNESATALQRAAAQDAEAIQWQKALVLVASSK